MDNFGEKQPLLDQKIPGWKRLLNVEPAMLFFSIACAMSSVNLQNWLLQKGCENWDFVNGTCRSELESQMKSSQQQTISSCLVTFLSICTAMFAGTMGDRNLKYLKLFILIPVIGQLLYDIVNCLNYLYLDLNGFFTALYAPLIQGISGNVITFIVIASSYISHTSTKKERTIKISYLMLAYNCGTGISNVIAGFLVQFYGILYSYYFCIGFEICATLSVLMFVETKNFSYEESIGKSHKFLQTMAEGIEVIKKRRPNNKHILIAVLIIIYGISCSYPIGETTVLYLYLRNQFQWDAFPYGLYSFLRQLISCLGSLFCAEILKRYFKLHDVTIGLIGGAFELTMALSFLIIQAEWQLYIAMSFGLFRGSLTSVSYSLASKCVEPHEYGRLSSIFGCSNVLIPIMIIIYNGLYELMISSFPDAIFLLTASFTTIVGLLFSYLVYLTHQEPLIKVKYSFVY